MDEACRIPSPDDRLARALEYCLAEVEAGRALDSKVVLSDHPDLPQLHACLPVLSLLQEVTETLPVGSDTVLPGRRIGDFVVHREIGRGGMGVVYEAEEVSLGRLVALKVLPAHLTLRHATIERFRREAATAARLRHAGIVPILAVGE